MRRILNFLSELEQNNNRDWFEQNRVVYEEARSLFEGFIAEVLSSLSRIDSRLRALTPKQVIFRIYRDTRFAHDKTPYKNNFGAHLSRGGRNTGEPGYYFHLQPGEGFLSAGIYRPDSNWLKAIRKEIYLFPEDYLGIVEQPEFKKRFTIFSEERLSRPPVGFPADFQLIEVLKNKHFCPTLVYPENWLDEPNLVDRVIEQYALMKPFNDFLYRSVET
ncbi:MAG: DUF2461 domain-containing protein [Bacteroidales bacterium]|nr:DUF2461 domain-containing protein [Bacteroidales bacterium]